MQGARNLVIPFIILFWGFTPAMAQMDGSFYLSTDIGMNFTPGFEFVGSSTDQGSVCDPFINPDAGSRQVAGCPTRGTGWKSVFSGGQGVLAGVAAGYRLGGRAGSLMNGLRIELEYVFRESTYDQTSTILSRSGVARDKLSDEIYRAEERVDSLTSHSFFGNVYYDFRSRSRLTPYVGLGAGVSATDLDNGRIWARNHDWMQIETGRDLPNAEEVRRNLAGTTSSFQGRHRATLLGYQVLLGADVAVGESLSIGLKARWADFGTFRATGTLDVLRSHAVPEDYAHDREAGPIRLWGISLNLKHRF